MKLEGCEYCTLKEKLDTWGETLINESIDYGILGEVSIWTAIIVRSKKLMLAFNPDLLDNSKEWFFKINYCPMCGRKL